MRLQKKTGTVQNFYVIVAITWKNYLVKKMIIKMNKSEKKKFEVIEM